MKYICPHIVEVGESLESVARRFLCKGLSVEETTQRISMPEDFVKQCLQEMWGCMEQMLGWC